MQPRSSGLRRILAGLAELPLTPAASDYLASRGLLEAATDLRFGAVPDSPAPRLRQYAGRLVIPSIGPEGNVYDVAFRCILPHDCKRTVLYQNKEGKDVTCKKYLFLDGVDKRLYNLQALVQANDTIDIVEGHPDTATLVACGLYAVGVPGVRAWKDHHPRLFQGFDRVRVWGDGDEAGKAFAKRVSNDVAGADVMMVPWTQDINEVFVQQGRDAVLAIAEGEDDDDHDDSAEWGLGPTGSGGADDVPWDHDSERPPF